MKLRDYLFVVALGLGLAYFIAAPIADAISETLNATAEQIKGAGQ